MTSASLNFVHNDDLFTVQITQNEISRVIWRSKDGATLADVGSLLDLPRHLAIYIAQKIKNEYHDAY